MAISSSLATKAGAVGTLVAGTGLGGTYLAWDHITLYAVEREVLGKDLQFTVTESTGESAPKTITISAPSHEDSKKESTLSKDYEWSCIITVDGAESTGENSLVDLASKIRDNLPTSEAKVKYWEKHKKDKARSIFVKACAGDRETTNPAPSNLKVKGKLTLKKDGSNNFKFLDHPELDDFVESELKTVEREVIEKDVKLKATANGTNTTVTVNTDTGNTTLTSSYSWTCEITLDPTDANITSKLQNNLPNSTTITPQQKINKELLVKACSQSRKDNPLYNSVTGLLTIKQEGNEKLFVNHPELNHLLKEALAG